MTPLEEQKMRAAAARNSGGMINQRVADAVGMFNPNATTLPDIMTPEQQAIALAARSSKGAESKLKQQQAYANSLRGAKMPEGREVGPSGIYVQANAGEMAKYLTDQAMGGYLAGQAGRDADALDEQQSQAAAAQLGIDRGDKKFDQDIKTGTLGVANRNATTEEGRLTESVRAALEGESLNRDKFKQQLVTDGSDMDIAERDMALDEGAFEAQEYKDADGNIYQVKWQANPETGELESFNTEGMPLNMEGLTKVNQYAGRSGRSGSGGGGTVKYPTRWTNLDGTVIQTYMKDGVDYNRSTHEPMPDGWMEEGGFYEEDAVTGSGRGTLLSKFAKETKGLRSIANDFTAMDDTMRKYGFDLMGGDDPLGRFEKDEGWTGDLTRMLQDASQDGAPTGEIYSSVRAVLNAVIREQAGMSQTVAEIEKLNKQYGTRWRDDPAIMAEALRRLSPKIKSDMRSQVATLDDTTRKELSSRYADLGETDWTQWGSGGAPKTKSGRGIGGNQGGEPKAIEDMTAAELEEELNR